MGHKISLAIGRRNGSDETCSYGILGAPSYLLHVCSTLCLRYGVVAQRSALGYGHIRRFDSTTPAMPPSKKKQSLLVSPSLDASAVFLHVMTHGQASAPSPAISQSVLRC